MKVLFTHQNFPGQYLHLARHFGSQSGHQAVFITQRQDCELPGVRKCRTSGPPARFRGRGLLVTC